MKRISAFGLALLLAASGCAFAASSHEDTRTTHEGTVTMHRLGADLRVTMHRIGRATRHALDRADAAMHRHGHSSGNV